MGRKKKPEPDDKEQSARFIELTERIELVENPKEAFEEAFSKIVKKRSIPHREGKRPCKDRHEAALPE
jgi:hypothetical protein